MTELEGRVEWWRSLSIKLPVLQSCWAWVCGSGFFRAAFFTWQPSGYLAQYLSCKTAPIYVKTNKPQERTQYERKWQEWIPLTVNIRGCISGCISGGSSWKLPETGGILCRIVWTSPFGSALCFFCTLSSRNHVHSLLSFFLCKTSIWKLLSPVIQSFTHSYIVMRAFYVPDTMFIAEKQQWKKKRAKILPNIKLIGRILCTRPSVYCVKMYFLI